MGEINEWRCWNVPEQPRAIGQLQLIPPDVRRFHARGKALALSFEQAQSWRPRGFGAAFKHPLHPHADAQKWDGTPDGLRDGILQS